jgi:2',3'-cyclic-nucleotide 2'-phosphodiesterase (5'-nucleotidase family)
MEWNGVDTLGTVDPKLVEYRDFIAVGTAEARRLREEEGCDAVIALTHMRRHNDLKLADSEADFDLILAGHDHDYQLNYSKKTGRLVLKSGTDFRSFSLVRLTWTEGEARPEVEVEKVEVTAEYGEDEQMKQLCQT